MLQLLVAGPPNPIRKELAVSGLGPVPHGNYKLLLACSQSLNGSCIKPPSSNWTRCSDARRRAGGLLKGVWGEQQFGLDWIGLNPAVGNAMNFGGGGKVDAPTWASSNVDWEGGGLLNARQRRTGDVSRRGEGRKRRRTKWVSVSLDAMKAEDAQRAARLLFFFFLLHVAFCHFAFYLVSLHWCRLRAAIRLFFNLNSLGTYNERDDDTSLLSNHSILDEYYTGSIACLTVIPLKTRNCVNT
ncbi:hypothetical protein M440DRAFT_153483 [Trichoderma longibrachiatum ATCC 18648]|uniref:Uncharacterized protein n=1 Tax=Trichoderma longibrachiatum ATCC 18648 TaxID=983965 RepID=A0A2T4BU65_TRILO|nr:hypothetical protein M440DRAFT_153483 [Trichoderma longibrachiatum ATCC 18648]